MGWLAIRRLSRSRVTAAAQVAALSVTIAVLLGVQLVSAVAEDAAYRSAVRLGNRDSLATVLITGGASPESFSQLQVIAAQAVASTTSDLMTLTAEYGTASGLALRSLNGDQVSSEGLSPIQAVYYPALQHKAELISGAWPMRVPTQDLQATASTDAAHELGWKLGDLLCLSATSDSALRPAQTCARLTGIWRPLEPKDAFWLSGPPSNAITFSAEGYWALLGALPDANVTSSRVYQPATANLTLALAPTLESGIKRLRSTLLADGRDLYTTLDGTIAGFLDRSAVSRYPVYVVGACLIVVTLIGLAFLSEAFLGTQQTQCILFRIRGWSGFDVARFLSLQLIVLTAPALLIGITVAVAAARLQAARSQVEWATFWADVASGIGGALVLTAGAVLLLCLGLAARFSFRTLAELRRMTQSSVLPPVLGRLRNLDLALAVLAVPVLFEASLRGSAVIRSQNNGIDWVGLALPIVGLILLALAALRALPLVVQPLRPLGNSLARRLTLWRLGRQSDEHAGLALLLSLVTAVALFAPVYATTATANATDRAAYAIGADVRIALVSGADPEAVSAELSQFEGVTEAMSAIRQRIQISSVPGTALALDATNYGRVAWSRPDLTSVQSALARLSGHPASLELSGQPVILRLSVRGLTDALSIRAVVRDASGQRCQCLFGSVQGGAWQSLQTQIVFPKAASYPLYLEAIRIDRSVKGSPGAIDLAQLQAISGSQISPVETFEAVTGWWSRDSEGLVTAPDTAGIQNNGRPALHVPVGAAGNTTVNPPFGRDQLSVLMSNVTISNLALKIGDLVPLTIDSHQIVARLAGSIGYVPTLYPGSEDFVVLPIDRAVSSFAATLSRSVSPNELWLAMTGAGEQVSSGASSNPDINFVVTREHEQNLAVNDPILVELNANLAAGLAGAVILAIIAFVLHFLISARRRVVDHAILEANGLEPADIRRGLALEQVLIILYAISSGAVLAGIAILVLLPSIQFGTTPEAVIPPTMISVDWPRLGLYGAAVVAIAYFFGWLTLRSGTIVEVVEEIRKLG